MYTLGKLSVPGWEFKTEYIEHVYWLLDQCICDSCKITESRDYSDYEYYKPETYDQWSLAEKVDWLLGTSCGCEFDLTIN